MTSTSQPTMPRPHGHGRGEVAARARAIYDQQAKERQKARKGNQAGASVENLPQLETTKSRDAAGRAVGVSGKSVGIGGNGTDAVISVVSSVGSPASHFSTRRVAKLRASRLPEVFEGGDNNLEKSTAYDCAGRTRT